MIRRLFLKWTLLSEEFCEKLLVEPEEEMVFSPLLFKRVIL